MFPYKGNGKVIHNINKEMNISLNTPLTLLDKKSVFETWLSYQHGSLVLLHHSPMHTASSSYSIPLYKTLDNSTCKEGALTVYTILLLKETAEWLQACAKYFVTLRYST